jgi:hypothetical protein
LTLPFAEYLAGRPGGPDEPVALRVDVEATAAYSRPRLERLERARDFVLADDSGHALVRLGHGGRLHADVELHFDAPFVARALEAAVPPSLEAAVPLSRTAYARGIGVGDRVYVLGPVSLEADPTGLGVAGYRQAPLVPVFAPAPGAVALHLYDEPAFEQLAAWHALPWYRKLSVLVRNR